MKNHFYDAKKAKLFTIAIEIGHLSSKSKYYKFYVDFIINEKVTKIVIEIKIVFKCHYKLALKHL